MNKCMNDIKWTDHCKKKVLIIFYYFGTTYMLAFYVHALQSILFRVVYPKLVLKHSIFEESR